MKFNFEATGVGSVPFLDPGAACQVIFDYFARIPFWPQLPKRSYLENMYVQYSERLPGLVLDEKNKTIHIDREKAIDLFEEVYGKCVASDTDYFKISETHGAGFYKFLDFIRDSGARPEFLKGHITGPVSFALFLTDNEKKAVIYDRDLFEILTKVLSMKAAWQIRELKKLNSNVIISIDEPYLVSLGSSYVNMDIALAMEKLDELSGAIRREGALSAIHCCGNTDWSVLLKRDIDILSFDAYNFMKELALYPEDVKNFFEKGKTIAWGIVPSGDAVEKETAETLAKRLTGAMDLLAEKGVEIKRSSSLITPSCGVGTLDDDLAKKVLEMTKAVSEKMAK